MYVPKIRDDQVKLLYQLKVKTGIPMTHLVREAVDQFLEWAAPQSPEMLKGHFEAISREREPMSCLQDYAQLRTEKAYDTPLERLLCDYEQRAEDLEKENAYLKARQEELVEFSEDWLNFEQASDDIKWFAVKVLKELQD